MKRTPSEYTCKAEGCGKKFISLFWNKYCPVCRPLIRAKYKVNGRKDDEDLPVGYPNYILDYLQETQLIKPSPMGYGEYFNGATEG